MNNYYVNIAITIYLLQTIVNILCTLGCNIITIHIKEINLIVLHMFFFQCLLTRET